ncbi:MAG: hypothetical protein E6G44_07215 [Actinobacteria bacterium]|nr:MAG: hypothetical protein E6G44_07215 [Actinomycetota bacterium]
MNGTPIRVTLALASFGAAVIHFIVTPQHLQESTLFGAFFLGLGLFQVVWGGAILAKPNTVVVLAGVIVSAVTIGIWALSRTAGLPVGPDPGMPEAVGLLDTLAGAMEAMIVLGGIYLFLAAATSEPRTISPHFESRERRAAA